MLHKRFFLSKKCSFYTVVRMKFSRNAYSTTKICHIRFFKCPLFIKNLIWNFQIMLVCVSPGIYRPLGGKLRARGMRKHLCLIMLIDKRCLENERAIKRSGRQNGVGDKMIECILEGGRPRWWFRRFSAYEIRKESISIIRMASLRARNHSHQLPGNSLCTWRARRNLPKFKNNNKNFCSKSCRINPLHLKQVI